MFNNIKKSLYSKTTNFIYLIIVYSLWSLLMIVLGGISVLWLSKDTNNTLISLIIIVLLNENIIDYLFNVNYIKTVDFDKTKKRLELIKWSYSCSLLYGLIINQFFSTKLNNLYLIFLNRNWHNIQEILYENPIHIIIVCFGPLLIALPAIFIIQLLLKSKISNEQKLLNVFIYAYNHCNLESYLPIGISKFISKKQLNTITNEFNLIRDRNYQSKITESDFEFFEDLQSNKHLIKLTFNQIIIEKDAIAKEESIHCYFLACVEGERITEIIKINMKNEIK